MTTMPKPVGSFEIRGAKDADPATASLVEDIALARETDYFLMKDQLTAPRNSGDDTCRRWRAWKRSARSL